MKIEVSIKAALFIAVNYNQHLSKDLGLLISRCADALVETFQISKRSAMVVAGQALGEFVRGKSDSGWVVDINASTADAIFLVNRSSGERAFSIPGTTHLLMLG